MLADLLSLMAIFSAVKLNVNVDSG